MQTSMITAYIIFGLIFVWLFVISIFLFKTRQHYQRLTKKTQAGTLDTALDHLLDSMKTNNHDIAELQKNVTKLDENTVNYYQKIGFVRFNPFDRIGGEQSFVIALLDKANSGIVLNFLYTREGVRIYAKPVKEGNATED